MTELAKEFSHPGVSWKQQRPSGAFDAIVIGSGIGGLACASALARYAQRRVLVLERHYRVGGYTQVFARPGYEWDVGVHYMGQMRVGGALRKAFDQVTDGTLEWAPLPNVYDRIFLGTKAYDFVSGQEPLIEKLGEYFPNEKQVLRRYFSTVEAANRGAPAYYVEKVVPQTSCGRS